MSSRVAAVALVAVIAFAVWWWWPRQRESVPTAIAPVLVPSLSLSPTTSTMTIPTPAPLLPALPPPPAPIGPPKLPPEAFAAEPRDDLWARPHESDLHHLAATLGDVQVSNIECRASVCKLSLAGTTGAVGRAIEILGGAHGVHAPITLSATTIGSDAATTVNAYIAFPRRIDPDAASTD